jgi:hypothetical protein
LKHKHSVIIKSKVCSRPHVRVMEKIRNKIGDLLIKRLGARYGPDVMKALESSNLDMRIKTLIARDKVQILDQ